MKKKEFLKEASKLIRLRLLELTYIAGKNGAHIGGSLSCVEAMVVLYYNHLNYW